MTVPRNILNLCIFSIAAVALGGCGGGSSPATPAPAVCAAGQVNCIQAANATIPNCQAQTTATSGPMVYGGPQYGCLATAGCPGGQGRVPGSNPVQCISGMVAGGIDAYGQYEEGGTYSNETGSITSGCPLLTNTTPPMPQRMTSHGCEPVYHCPDGTGWLDGRCQ